MSGKPWSKEELIVTLNLYFKLEYSKIDAKNPEVISLASITGRTPNSIAMRLANFISCDPELKARGIKGLNGGLTQCQPIWDDFSNDKNRLSEESERISKNWKNKNLPSTLSIKKKVFFEKIDTELIWRKVLNCLATNHKVRYFGKNPYHLTIDNNQCFVFIRNLTRAYTNKWEDVCRIQLPKSTNFEFIKKTNTPLVVLGYCDQYNTVAYWPSNYVKPRLNTRENVSLYSRFSSQVPLKKGKQQNLKLNNGQTVKITNMNDIALIFSKNSIKYADLTIEEGLFSTAKKVEEKQEIYSEKKLFLLLKKHINDASEINSIQICTSYFESQKIKYNLLMVKKIIAKVKAKYKSKT